MGIDYMYVSQTYTKKSMATAQVNNKRNNQSIGQNTLFTLIFNRILR